MRRRTPSGNRLLDHGSRSRISVVVFAMLATLSAIYVAGRLSAGQAERCKRHHNTFCDRKKSDHIEAPEELPRKSMLFFIHAVEMWDAEFYVKLNDDVFLNIDALGATLAANSDKPRAYMGCMKSGEVFSDATNKWYEPEWWKFGDKKSYFRHASGEIYLSSHELWLNLYQLTGPFSVHMPMMMSVQDLGLLALTLSTFLKGNFAARLGVQGQYVQLYEVGLMYASNDQIYQMSRILTHILTDIHITLSRAHNFSVNTFAELSKLSLKKSPSINFVHSLHRGSLFGNQEF